MILELTGIYECMENGGKVIIYNTTVLCGGALIFGAINIYLKEDVIQQLHKSI